MSRQTAFREHEAVLNRFYNVGGFNKPERIGYMMKMIRELKPSSMMEWMYWYFEHVHCFPYLYNLAIEFWKTIPTIYEIEFKEALAYIGDVMFYRTFNGYNKEASALQILRKAINLISKNHQLIGTVSTSLILLLQRSKTAYWNPVKTRIFSVWSL